MMHMAVMVTIVAVYGRWSIEANNFINLQVGLLNLHQSQKLCKISKEQFKAMSVDDKLVSMFDMMTGFTSLNKRVQNIEHNMETMLLQNDKSNRRMK